MVQKATYQSLKKKLVLVKLGQISNRLVMITKIKRGKKTKIIFALKKLVDPVSDYFQSSRMIYRMVSLFSLEKSVFFFIFQYCVSRFRSHSFEILFLLILD